ncbi:hypothetical protein L596_029314 [Steinernema carpocapsae]|uniref:Secreted protein n=1 Tax=Steinernema carpocapsae TaxID=34508 RepID=A0A4U5LUA5_STECR|nr:hypothetical protein L596_029314 [Steinernema carpocapsae]
MKSHKDVCLILVLSTFCTAKFLKKFAPVQRCRRAETRKLKKNVSSCQHCSEVYFKRRCQLYQNSHNVVSFNWTHENALISQQHTFVF